MAGAVAARWPISAASCVRTLLPGMSDAHDIRHQLAFRFEIKGILLITLAGMMAMLCLMRVAGILCLAVRVELDGKLALAADFWAANLSSACSVSA